MPSFQTDGRDPGMFHYMRECDENEALHYLTLTPYVTLRKEKEINYTPIGMYWMRRRRQWSRPADQKKVAVLGSLDACDGQGKWSFPQTDSCAPCRSTRSTDRFMCAVPKHPFRTPEKKEHHTGAITLVPSHWCHHPGAITLVPSH